MEKNIIANNKSNSYLSMLISSMIIFGTVGIFRRNIDASSSLIAFARGAIGALVIGVFMKATGKKVLDIDKKNKNTLIFLIISGAVMGFNWIFLFEAFNYTSVSIATLCYYMEPTIVALASVFLFKEKLGIKRFICVVVALLGMVFVSGIIGGDGFDSRETTGIAFGLAAALFYSIVVLMNKKLSDVDQYLKTVIQLGSAALSMIPYIIITGEFKDIGNLGIDMRSIALILVVGILHTGIAYVLYFGSINGLRAQTVAIFSYIDPVVALILSGIILHETMTPIAIIGSVLIIGSTIVNEIVLE